MPNSLDREAFEAAACLEWPTEEPATLLARSIRTDGYRSRAVDDAWRWWQAGAAAEREACAKICEDIRDKTLSAKYPEPADHFQSSVNYQIGMTALLLPEAARQIAGVKR